MTELMLECRNLTKVFGTFRAVDSVDITVNRGEVMGLLGSNGAGKTTIIKILATLLHPTAGRASVAGIDVMSDAIEVRKKIGYLPETPSLYDHLTGREFLELIGELRDAGEIQKRADELGELFGLHDFMDTLIGTYSKGLKQRIAFAQAIMHKPEILLLDEPLVGLDPRYSKYVKDYVKEFGTKGGTVLVTTHLTEMAEAICSRIIIIHRGRIRACGTIDNVKKQTNTQNLEEAFIALVEDNKVS